MEIGLLVSGQLGYHVFQHLVSRFKVNFVLTDKQSNGILNLCQETGIPVFAGNPRGGKARRALPNAECEVLVSVNYIFLIDSDLISLPSKLAINFHGSLLPKYRGRTPHVWAIINGESQTGITAHVIDDRCDAGAILKQAVVPIGTDDTGASVLGKYAALYPSFVTDVLESVKGDTFETREQDDTFATYFGKRTPEDGRINWDWQKERIRNWIRAQARPYPGAYSYCETSKVIIHKVAFSEHGFHGETMNGAVVEAGRKGVVVKTPNGCVVLIDYETDKELKENDVLK